MSGFQVARTRTVGDFVHHSTSWRLLPLYLASIVVGIAGGVAFSINSTQPPSLPLRGPDTSAAAVAPAAPSAYLSPSIAPRQLEESAEAAAVVLPATMLLPEKAPAVEPVAPVAAAPVIAPVAAAPVIAPVAVPAEAAVPAPVQPAPIAVKPAPVAESAPAPAPAVSAPAPRPSFYVPDAASGGASNLEQRLFDGMNAERAKAGLAPFVYDAGLTRIARTRSQQMADQGYFGHVDPSGYSMYSELLKHFGYTSYAWAGENLAMNNYGVSDSSERSLVTLMNSPTHRANILAGDFFRVGVGEVTTSDGRHIYAMIFIG